MKTQLQTAFLLLLSLPLLAISSKAEAYTYIHACKPVWEELPVQYLINEKGSRDFADFSQIESLLHTSFQAWETPCCSNFRSEYLGTTDQTEALQPGPVIISFADDQFPPQFGGPDTIAITYSMLFYESCTLNQSIIVFNGADHRFFHAESDFEWPDDESDAQDYPVDFQSVATHEIGHLLGLGHSHLEQATMFPHYMGGISARHLDVDDIRGVCSLYTQTCACTTNQDCLPGQQCGANGCEDIPCTADSECSGSLVCLDGECVQQPCTNDSDCAPDFQCRNSLCVSKCPTCRPCTSSLDCDGGTCLDIYQETKKCLVLCADDLSCPGDSTCFDLSDEDGPFFVCLNPDAETEDLCPESYLCKESSSTLR